LKTAYAAAEVEPYSQQMAHSDGIFIRTSSANGSEDEQHPFTNQISYPAVSSNDTARGALDRPLESHNIVPEVTSVSLFHTIWVLIFIEYTLA
jgi:hypothetical protein